MNRNKNMLKKIIKTALSLASPYVVQTTACAQEVGGLEIIQSIRKDLNQVPIIAMSVGDRYGQNYLKASADFGANGIMKKPFTADELMNQVSYWLSQTR
jgi:DNA-binding response OmpR family regulator